MAEIDTPDIAEYLASADDFAFEREVYHIANGLRFDAEHAALYTDPVTDKPRQFDIRASYTQGSNKIALAIECKGIKRDFPLLVSCVPRTSREASHQVLIASQAMGLNTSYTRVESRPSPMGYGIYPPAQGVGKSMRQVRRETKGPRQGEMVSGDDVFDKWMQALASLAEMIESGAYQLSPGPNQPLRKIAFLPVLVVPNDTLWIAAYSSRGALEQEPFKVDEITYYLGRKYHLPREDQTLVITHLHIFSRKQIGEWLQGIARGGGIWQELFGA